MPVTIRTNPFKPIEPQYSHGLIIPLSEATDDTLKLTQTLIFDLKPIYRPGYAYIKVGIMLVKIVQNNQTQVDLFPDVNARTRYGDLMKTKDTINQRYGKSTVGLGITGIAARRSWSMKRGNKTVGYITNWDELPIVMA